MGLLERIPIPGPNIPITIVIGLRTYSWEICEELESALEAITNPLVDIAIKSEIEYPVRPRVAVLAYSRGVQWITPDAAQDTGCLRKLRVEEGRADLGMAYCALNLEISSLAYRSQLCPVAPINILISDGNPTDQWENPLYRLRQNPFFGVALNLGILLGTDANHDVLAQFTRNPKLVLNKDDLSRLQKLLRYHCMNWIFRDVVAKRVDDDRAQIDEDELAVAISELTYEDRGIDIEW
ncbi:MAG: VWA domain-containing protein [Polyangiaceae bacterium]|nr:VWA domain-containing protein [Polyangiaceae bacterium]